MSTRADAVYCDWDEDGLHLHVVPDEGDDLDILFPDPDALLAAVRAAVDPWVAEREAARASMPTRMRDADDSDCGYDLADPKHPRWHETMAGHYDQRAGK